MRWIVFFSVFLCFAITAEARVEIGLENNRPTVVEEVYLQNGVPFLALDDILPPLQMGGWWDSVRHVYRITTPRGKAYVSPGSNFLKIGDRFIHLDHPPRFIDGRLRIAEEVVTDTLAGLAAGGVYYRNLNPLPSTPGTEESSLERLFAFLLHKKKVEAGPALRAVALDPGHGGQDPGALGLYGIKEKDVASGVARQLEKLLKMRLGIPVYLSRDGDYDPGIEKRLKAVARPEVDALVQLHAQADFGPDSQGVRLYIRTREDSEAGAVPAIEGDSLRLARHLMQSMEDAGFRVAPIEMADLMPLGRGNLPTVLVEMGYLGNPDDYELLSRSEGQIKLAEALYSGLERFAENQKEKR